MILGQTVFEIFEEVIQRSFRGGTRGNAVPIVEMLSGRMGTEFPFLICTGIHGNGEKHNLFKTEFAINTLTIF